MTIMVRSKDPASTNPVVLFIDEADPIISQFLTEHAAASFPDPRLLPCTFHRYTHLNTALTYLTQQTYALVFLNLSLPDSQGQETFRRFRQQAPYQSVVVILTNQDRQLTEWVLAQGAIDVLFSEELTIPLLLQAIRQGGLRAPQQQPMDFISLTELSSDVLLHFDASTRQVMFCNRPVIWGYTTTQLITSYNIKQVVHPDDRLMVHHYWQNILQSPDDADRTRLTYRIFTSEGHLCWVESYYWVYRRHESGLPHYIVVLLRDVTTHKDVEHGLQRQTAYLFRLVELAQRLRAAATVADMIPVIMEQCVQFAATYSTLFLVEEQSGDLVMMGHHPPQELEPPFRLKPDQGIAGYVIQTDQLYFTDDLPHDPRVVIIPSQNSDLLNVQTLLALPLRFANQIVGVYILGFPHKRILDQEEMQLLYTIAEIAGGSLHRARMMESWEHDLTMRTMELAAANERLRELDQLKSRFVHDVSHELRTPISNLRLYADLLERGTPQKREHYHAVIKSQAQRLSQLVEDILSLSRLDLGKEWVQFVPTNLNEVVAVVVQAHAAQAEMANLQLSFQPDETLPLFLAEPNQLSQVVSHLLVNALKYTAQGLVMVRTYMAEDRSCICLEVRDTGMGIHAEDFPHLFKRFYRGQQTSQSTISGTGLGLAIVWEIVNLHRGRVDVENHTSGGANFRVWFPITVDGLIAK